MKNFCATKPFLLFILFWLLFHGCLYSQVRSIIKGIVIDATTERPLAGATISILKTDPIIGQTANENGKFTIELKVGVYDISVSYVGYESALLPQVRCISGKDTELEVRLSESFEALNEVVVTNSKGDQASENKMALVSSVVFNSDLAGRFAGSLGDPARMVTAYAGVAAPGDQRNDISVRGNSPAGLLWRIEGMNVPNPNHFAAAGSTGGVISLLNSNLIKKSDFFVSAFLPEYGNVYSGVFDLNLREGNTDKHLFTGQMGFSGFEGNAEGPIDKKKSGSYLAAYRYSTPGVFNLLGIPLIGGALPQYQDLSFKVLLKGRNDRSKLSIWGIGGLSQINVLFDDIKNSPKSTFSGYIPDNTNTLFGSNIGMLGVNYNRFVHEETLLKLGFLTSYSQTFTDSEKNWNPQSNLFVPFYKIDARNYGLEFKAELSGKISRKASYKSGFFVDVNGTYLQENLDSEGKVTTMKTLKNTNVFGNTTLQPYIQVSQKLRENISLVGGVNALYYLTNNTLGIDPRINIGWKPSKTISLNLGYGLHHRLQSQLTYYAQEGLTMGGTQSPIYSNKDLKPTRSNHYVLGFNWDFAKNLRFKTDVYYHYLDQVPISKIKISGNTDQTGVRIGSGQTMNPVVYSTLNSGSSFNEYVPTNLENKGTGQNYGVEFTLERMLYNGFYLLTTTSLFRSTYVASDGNVHNTSQNLGYIVNFSSGYEYKLRERNKSIVSWFADVSSSFNGGRPYRGVFVKESEQAGYAIYDDDNIYNNRFTPYRNINTKLGLRLNRPKTSQYLSLEFKNMLNTPNIFGYSFSVRDHKVVEKQQLQQGFLWIITYRINF